MEKNWFSKTVMETVEELQTDLKQGLTQKQVQEKQGEYGLNELRQMFLDFFESKDHLVRGSYSLVPHNDNSVVPARHCRAQVQIQVAARNHTRP